ncbi:MAG: ATP-binding protein [Muribaculaceae bacterium]|nr:ATP-binding protein [Muribaculaceae bacterium]
MKRDVLKELIEWKESPMRLPLIMTGVRQCGKTYILQKFGKENYPNVAYVNFEQDGKFVSVFETDLRPQRILSDFALMGVSVSRDTLLILDEIQLCPRAITSLKYFAEQMPELHVVAAGSLLGVVLNRGGISFPVGKVTQMTLYPMSFREFATAMGKEPLLDAIGNNVALDAPLPEHYAQPLEVLLRDFYAVGGMPSCVRCWKESHDMEQVERLQLQILSDYQNDFAKHAPTSDIPKLGWIWDSVPVQLAKENNKFVFSHVRESKRSSELEDALRWLVDAGLIYTHKLVENIEIPLSCYANSTHFKVYMVDVGLMRAKIRLPIEALMTKSAEYQTFKGAFTENYVKTELVKQGIESYYWRSKNAAEVDFVFQSGTRILPLEAKAELSTKAKSYSVFCKRFNSTIGFKVSMKNVGLNDVGSTHTYSLPLYMLWRLKSYQPTD